MSCEFANLDAAYVLGSLAPAERADYERHLKGCDDCSRSMQELAGLPGLLARVPAEVLELLDRDPVPPTLLPAIVAAAQKQQRRRTTRTALLAAAAVAVIAAGSAAVAASLDGNERHVSSPPPAVETTAPPQLMTPVGDGQSEGWVSLTPVADGTRLDLTCTYRSTHGSGHAYEYKLVIRTKEGLKEDITSFEATPDAELRITDTTTTELDEIVRVEVRNSYGAILWLTP